MIGVTEHRVRFNITRDLFGFIDFVVIRPDEVGVLGLQVTTFGNRLDRIKKILTKTSNEAETWLRSGNQIEVWGWKRPNVKQRRWLLKRDCVIIGRDGKLTVIDMPLGNN